jgi:hypothetical protein
MVLIETLKSLNQLNTGGVIGFFNTLSNKVLLVESSNLLVATTRVLHDVHIGNFKSNAFILDWNGGLIDRVEVLFTNAANDHTNRYLKVKELLDCYKDKTLYRPVKYTNLLVEKKLEKFKKDFVITVNLVNWNSTITVGVFEHGLEAEKFISETYPNKKVTKVIYASNDLTKEFLTEVLIDQV